MPDNSLFILETLGYLTGCICCAFVCVAAVVFIVLTAMQWKELPECERASLKIPLVIAVVLLVLFALGAWRLGQDFWAQMRLMN